MAKKKELIEEAEIATLEEEALEEVESFESEEEEIAHEGTDDIFPFGPSYDQLGDWKSRYDGEIYMSDFDDTIFLWRPIRRKEFRDIQRIEGAKDEYYMEESICRACVLWPEDYALHRITFGKAGIPTTLSQLIMERSGFLRPMTMKL